MRRLRHGGEKGFSRAACDLASIKKKIAVRGERRSHCRQIGFPRLHRLAVQRQRAKVHVTFVAVAHDVDGVVSLMRLRPSGHLRQAVLGGVEQHDLHPGLRPFRQGLPTGNVLLDEHRLLPPAVREGFDFTKDLRSRHRIGHWSGGGGCHHIRERRLRRVVVGRRRVGVNIRLNRCRGIGCRRYAGGVEHEARFQRHCEHGGRRFARLAGATVPANALRTTHARHSPSPRHSPHRPTLCRKRLSISVKSEGRYHLIAFSHNDVKSQGCEILFPFYPIRATVWRSTCSILQYLVKYSLKVSNLS
ncbi:hypothetical protein [Azospirillum sp. TSH20]|uniref:hypothetical protein n=1 Tax=Azospirillum sp. TSH20 TaxID=652754 RepID=UPI001FFFD099|nr:hypothetical protein [Azospirillum sp. TSH20]